MRDLVVTLAVAHARGACVARACPRTFLRLVARPLERWYVDLVACCLRARCWFMRSLSLCECVFASVPVSLVFAACASAHVLAAVASRELRVPPCAPFVSHAYCLARVAHASQCVMHACAQHEHGHGHSRRSINVLCPRARAHVLAAVASRKLGSCAFRPVRRSYIMRRSARAALRIVLMCESHMCVPSPSGALMSPVRF